MTSPGDPRSSAPGFPLQGFPSERPRSLAKVAAPARTPPFAAQPVTAAPVEKAVAEAPTPNWPFYVVMCYLIVDFARPQDWVRPLGALRPGIVVLSLGLLALVVRRQEIVFPARAKLILLFFFLMAALTPFSTNGFHAFTTTKDLTLWFFGAALPLMSFTNTFRRIRVLIWLFILIHVPLAIYSITHNGVGIGAFLSDENDFCLALNIAIPYIFFSFFFVKGAVPKMVLAGAMAILLFATTATLSRGGFLGVVAIGILCWASSPRRLASLALLVILSVPMVAMIPHRFWTEMQTIETADQEGDTGEQRLYLWGMAWRMFLDHPILGVGPTNFQWNSDKYESKERAAEGLHIWGKAAHSIYFTLLPEEGLTGVVVFLAIIALNTRENYRIRAKYRACVAQGTIAKERLEELRVLSILTSANDGAMVGYFVSGAFLSVLYYPHFWLQTAFAIMLSRVFWRLVPEQSTSAVRSTWVAPARLRPLPAPGASR